MQSKFVFHEDIAPVQVAEGAMRRVLAYSDALMAVEMYFEKGAVGAVHAHPHEQVTYIISGAFAFTNDGETKEVRAGDSLRFAPGTMHGTVCLEKGRLLDVFTPHREDFLA